MKKLYNPLLALLFLIGMMSSATSSDAQVTTSDSLTLVRFYNSTGGATWSTRTNWLIGSVSTWYGIRTAAGRVTGVTLPANNLTGAITDSLYRLTALKKAVLNNNKLTRFPTLTGLHLDTLALQNNQLTFRDLLPNKPLVDSFYYAPQDSVDIAIDTTVVEQSAISLVASVDNNPSIGDSYEWFNGTTSIVISGSNTYSILCMDSASAGTYYTRITNGQLPLLTLYRRAITLRVKGLADPGAGFSVCSSSTTLRGVRPAGSTVIWTVVSGGSTLASDTVAQSVVNNLGVGPNVFQYAVSANNISCPANTYSIARVIITRDTNPSPPYAGADLSVCSSQAPLFGSTPSAGTGLWTVIRGTGVVAQPNSPSTAVNGLSSGENILRWQITNGSCAPSYFDEVKVYRDDTLAAVYAGVDTSICLTSYTLTAVLPDNAHGVWTVLSGSATFADGTSPVSQVTGLRELTNNLRWTVSNSCNTVSDDVSVNVYGFTRANAGQDKEVFYSPITKYPLGDTVAVGTGGTGVYTYVWTPDADLDNPTEEHPKFLTPDTGSYTFNVVVTDSHGCIASDDVNYHVTRGSILAVPSLFTPNNDGVNDELYIPGIESYPNNELTVVDRNDQIVFKQKGYKNDWKAVNEEGFAKLGKKLPADTYFYTLMLEEGKPLQKGFIVIKY